MGNNLNQKSFTLKTNRVKEITLRILGFPINKAIALLLSISPITLQMTAKKKIKKTIALSLKKLRFVLSNKLKNRAIVEVVFETIFLTYAVKIIRKLTFSITTGILSITNIAKIKLRNILNINTGFQHITLTVISAILKKLSEFDPQTLSALDSLTLGQMDHT